MLNSLQCFTHSLPLAVNDGLRETKAIRRAMAKSCKSSFLHTSCIVKEAFETTFDTKGIHAVFFHQMEFYTTAN